ncbi:MAG: alpha/beta hydrolase [Chloroflexi bacterium]|nr:alpha/beta hydrolase [Chloroflexota bacterium]
MSVNKTVVFIHGMYMTPLCWEGWVKRFESQGYRCLAPAWPGRDKSVKELQTPDSKLGKLNLADILDHLTQKIQALYEKPILIGHSMGGLVTQILNQRGLASAAVAIDSAPPAGVFSMEFSFLKANWGHITPFANPNSPVIMTFERFQYAFVNGMSLDEQRAAFDKYVVPESRAIPRQSLTSVAKIDFKKEQTPLLLIAGGADHIIPASLTKTNYEKYKASPSVTDFKEFAERNHFLLGQKGWEEIADYVLGWLSKQ